MPYNVLNVNCTQNVLSLLDRKETKTKKEPNIFGVFPLQIPTRNCFLENLVLGTHISVSYLNFLNCCRLGIFLAKTMGM